MIFWKSRWLNWALFYWCVSVYLGPRSTTISNCQLTITVWNAFDDVTAYLICKAGVRGPQTQHKHCQHAACDQPDQHCAQETTGTTGHTQCTFNTPSEAEEGRNREDVRQPAKSPRWGHCHAWFSPDSYCLRFKPRQSVTWILMIWPHNLLCLLSLSEN